MRKIQDTEVRWGIIGVGDVCEVKSAPAMQLIPHSSLIAVMRRDGAKAADYARRHGVPKWYDDATQLINDPEVNAIYIATPPNVHEAYTLQAAAAGKPVYVEKPMARTYTECLRMIEACTQAKVPLYVAYYRRTLPNFLKVKALLQDGAIGLPRLVTIELYKTAKPDIIAHLDNDWRVNPEIAGGGYYYDLASHQLDLLDYLFGPVKKVAGYSANQAGLYKAEDIVTGSFVFDSGVMGTGSWCFATARLADLDRATIIGSEGKITFCFFADSMVKLETDDGVEEVFDFPKPKHIQQPLIQTVVDDLLGTGTCPSTGITGARTNWVMEQMKG